MSHPSIIPEIICSKCGGKNIVIPNKPDIKYKCLDCGYIKKHDPWEKIQGDNIKIKDMNET